MRENSYTVPDLTGQSHQVSKIGKQSHESV